jgi:hypothetical protein
VPPLEEAVIIERQLLLDFKMVAKQEFKLDPVWDNLDRYDSLGALVLYLCRCAWKVTQHV